MSLNINNSNNEFLDFILKYGVCPIHPNFIRNNPQIIVQSINKFFKNNNLLNEENKWGFNYQIRVFLNTLIKENLNSDSSSDEIMNYIIYNFYNVKRKKDNNLLFIVKNPISIYEVVYKLASYLKKDNTEFADNILLDCNLKNIDNKLKKIIL